MPAKKTGLVATPPPIGGGIFSPRTEGPAGRAVWICSEDDGQGGCAEEGAVFWRLAHVGVCERELFNIRMCTRFGALVCVKETIQESAPVYIQCADINRHSSTLPYGTPHTAFIDVMYSPKGGSVWDGRRFCRLLAPVHHLAYLSAVCVCVRVRA